MNDLDSKIKETEQTFANIGRKKRRNDCVAAFTAVAGTVVAAGLALAGVVSPQVAFGVAVAGGLTAYYLKHTENNILNTFQAAHERIRHNQEEAAQRAASERKSDPESLLTPRTPQR